MQQFYIDILDSADQKQGGGPIDSAHFWEYQARMDQAGSFQFTMPASDSKASIVQKKRLARAYALLNGTWTEVGAGVIDQIERVPGPDGKVKLAVSGGGEERELTYRSVAFLELASAGNGITHSAALAQVEAFAPAGWTFNAAPAPGNDFVYGRFAGERVLRALDRIAEKTQTHWYRSGTRELTFAGSFTDSGVRAIRAYGDLAPETCAITDLAERIDTHDLITRIYPFGSGTGRARLTLAASNRAAPAGFTFAQDGNGNWYIENDAAAVTYGQIEEFAEFKDIAPVSNSDADVQAAANMLFDVALEALRRRSDELEQATYALTVAGCSQLLRPMQTIRLAYRDTEADMDIDTDLNILEATWRVDERELQTTGLVISSGDRWPQDDRAIVIDRMAEGQVFQAHPQLGPNSYVLPYNKPVDETETAEFRFRFGDEVTKIDSVLFEFQLLPLESTVKALGTETGGATPETGGPSTDTTSSVALATALGGTTETALGGGDDTSSEAPTTSSEAPTTSSEAPTTSSEAPTTSSEAPETSSVSVLTGSSAPGTSLEAPGTTSESPDTSLESPDTGNAEPVTTDAAPTTSLENPGTGSEAPDTSSENPSTGDTAPDTGDAFPDTNFAQPNTSLESPDTGGTELETNDPEGGDVVSGGQHLHDTPVYSAAGGTAVSIAQIGADWYFIANTGATRNIKTSQGGDGLGLGGNHTHSVNAHQHTIDSHSHTTVSHDHTTVPHNHTTPPHNHTTVPHTHTTAPHQHTTVPHTHTTELHSHTTIPHNHTTIAHDHTTVPHSHVVASHDHTTVAHEHTTVGHTHTTALHAHTTAPHSHTTAPHSHTTAPHSHTTVSHSHTTVPHSHTTAEHSHSLSGHTHSLSDHTHSLEDGVIVVYGIFRESAANTFALSDLEYQVNSGGWADLDTATAVGSDWHRLDITADVSNTTSGRPLQESNLLEIRRKAAGATGKSGQLDVQLSIRNTIQSIAFV